MERAGKEQVAVSLEESAVLDALPRGDEDAFARLVGEHHASLRRVARLYGEPPPGRRTGRSCGSRRR